MSVTPDISVVMSVYNGGSRLPKTVDSILSQENVSFEFIIVNDGSTDDTREMLEEYSLRDSRVKLIHQHNQGLTRSLIKGCAAARSKYVARQDAGDVSLPNRFSKQLALIQRYPEAAFVSCGTRYVGPSGEYLYDVQRNPASATASLRSLQMDTIQGPSSHPSTMFRKALYDAVGGYRPEFYFAQDLDLWIRLAERGKHVVTRELLYEAAWPLGSISSSYREKQSDALRLILESAQRRRHGLGDEDLLQKARTITSDTSESKTNLRVKRAKALYFIGSCLRKNHDPRAANYFRQALLAHPLHLKSAIRLLMR